ncbi:hypothetical protein [Aquimarina litoralis]|uniref:hypothetical protein n=1 Tax=Aquimarina litoralis TaxID=584605 RepID=UPI001C5908AD|nr:hypothetical protein [Aquimarina litoralis]MBW1297086.1 hypothetical protein [Aquimarina litoralis]
MKKIVIVLLLFSITTVTSQKGNVKVYFKNGEVAIGKGKLKGDKYINFKEKSSKKSKKLNFEELNKVEMTLKDSVVMTFKLHPIIKKNKTRKKPVVIGKLVSGKVNLYIKGDINAVRNSEVYHNGQDFTYTGVRATGLIHYFMKKEGEIDAIHLNSNQYTLKYLLKFTGKTFDACPDLFSKLYKNLTYEDTLEDFIKQYNSQCK